MEREARKELRNTLVTHLHRFFELFTNVMPRNVCFMFNEADYMTVISTLSHCPLTSSDLSSSNKTLFGIEITSTWKANDRSRVQDKGHPLIALEFPAL